MTGKHGLTLIIGGTGKVGRRVAERLSARGLPIRVGTRSSEPVFGWEGPVVSLVTYLFAEVLDGRNAQLADGVQRAPGRAPRDFAEYAWSTAGRGVWNP